MARRSEAFTLVAMTPEDRRRDRKPRSWDYDESQSSRSSTSGCGTLLVVAVIGAVIGGLIAAYTTPPETELYGPDYGTDAARLFFGAIAGFVIGFLVGVAILGIRDAVARRSR